MNYAFTFTGQDSWLPDYDMHLGRTIYEEGLISTRPEHLAPRLSAIYRSLSLENKRSTQ